MRIAVLGAGIAGLVAARRLSKLGHFIDVFERWPGLGGQVATVDMGAPDPIERYYHHLFTTDREIGALYTELGMPDAIEWRPSTVSMFADGVQYPFTTPGDLLRFKPLSMRSRLRMGAAVLWLQRRHREAGAFETMTAKSWIVAKMGEEAWERVWGPLLRGKFGSRAEDISMAWLWSKLTLRRRIEGREARREMLGYPQGGWQPLLDRLRDEVEAGGGRVFIDRPARRIAREGQGLTLQTGAPGSYREGHDPAMFPALDEVRTYDAILATVPSPIMLALLDDGLKAQIGTDYRRYLESAEYHTALCVLLELDRQFSPYYWTNVADRRLPFVGLVEHTNLIPPERYGGARYLYIANYLEPDDPMLALNGDELLDAYEPGLRKVNPGFSRDWIRQSLVFREPAAQPIVTPGYAARIPSLATPAAGLFLANTTQIYPEDRGTNYSVRLGEMAATAIDATAIGN